MNPLKHELPLTGMMGFVPRSDIQATLNIPSYWYSLSKITSPSSLPEELNYIYTERYRCHFPRKSLPTPPVFLGGFPATSPTTPSFTLSSNYTALFSLLAFHVKFLSASGPLHMQSTVSKCSCSYSNSWLTPAPQPLLLPTLQMSIEPRKPSLSPTMIHPHSLTCLSFPGLLELYC